MIIGKSITANSTLIDSNDINLFRKNREMTIEVVDSIEQENLELKERVITEFTKVVEAINGEWIPTLIKDRTMSFVTNSDCMAMTGSFQVATEEVPRYLDVEEPGVCVFSIDTDDDEIDMSYQALFFALDRSFSMLGIQRPGPTNPIVKAKAANTLVNCINVLNAIRGVDAAVAYPSIRINVVRGHDGAIYTRICGYVRAGSYVVRVQMGYQSGFFYNESIFNREPTALAHIANVVQGVALATIKADTVISVASDLHNPGEDLCKAVWAKSCETPTDSAPKMMMEDFIRTRLYTVVGEIDNTVRAEKVVSLERQQQEIMNFAKAFTLEFTSVYDSGLRHVGEHKSKYLVSAMQSAFITALQSAYLLMSARQSAREAERAYRLNVSLINRAMDL